VPRYDQAPLRRCSQQAHIVMLLPVQAECMMPPGTMTLTSCHNTSVLCAPTQVMSMLLLPHPPTHA
jgi:hypothetical protein